MSTSTTPLFETLTPDTAPAGAQSGLEKVQKKFGFLPNLVLSLANSPALLNAYLAVANEFDGTSFTPGERQVILLATSVENECYYCSAAHSTIAKNMAKVDAAVVDAIRDHTPINDPKLRALVNVTRDIVINRGNASAESVAEFLAAGYTPEQLAEVLVGVAQKTISNYLNRLSPPEVDVAFAAEART